MNELFGAGADGKGKVASRMIDSQVCFSLDAWVNRGMYEGEY